jgi:drug/metabolite transporter (DMT)-like permease
VDPLVFGLVALAATMHVTWNVIVKTAGDPLRAATLGNVAAAIVIGPVAAIGWLVVGRPHIPPAALGLGALSGLVQGAYLLTLAEAYRRGGLSLVYPLARGTGTLLAVAIGVGLLGERLAPAGTLGVALLLVGLLWLQRPWRLLALLGRVREGAAGSAVPWALGTGALIAVYSAIDRTGTQLVEPWFYAGLLWAGMAITLIVAVRLRIAWGAAAGPALTPPGRRLAVIGGLMALATYFLILVAYRLAPLTAVVPLRESAVVLASGWGAFRLREANGPRDVVSRLAASILIVLGAVLLAVSR